MTTRSPAAAAAKSGSQAAIERAGTVRENRSYQGIQVLRFVAAMMVVVTHSTFMVGERLLGVGDSLAWRVGNAGVDIFFVISGFVMAISSSHLVGAPGGASVFVVRRLVRIVPLYWLATTLKLLAVAAIPAATLHSEIDLPHLIASYLFLPAFNAEGEIKPLLAVGWTLTLEMFFYALFALALALHLKPARFLSLVLVPLALLSNMPGKEGIAAFVYLDGILLEFLFGVFLAQVVAAGHRPSSMVSSLLVIVGAALLFVPPSDLPLLSHRAFYWGIPALLLVAGVVFLEPAIGSKMPRRMTEWGDASYALYLMHTLLVPFIGVILVKLGWVHPVATVVFCMVASQVLATLCHRLFEKPVTRWLRRRVESGQPGAALALR